MNEIK